MLKKDQDISNYINLRNRQLGQRINLNNHSVVIFEKLANLLNLEPDDKSALNTNNGREVKLPTGRVCEMYMGRYVSMNLDIYGRCFDQRTNTNAQLIELKSGVKTDDFANSLTKVEVVNAINLDANNKQVIDSLIQGMDKVMLLLIGLAAPSAIAVIFTLTTTNLEERIREVSASKVLGFYNKEASLYIYRGTTILSIFGILFGFLIGNQLHSFIIDNLAPMNAMSRPGILMGSYLFSAIIPLAITVIMATFVNHKIKDVNMLETLKSLD